MIPNLNQSPGHLGWAVQLPGRQPVYLDGNRDDVILYEPADISPVSYTRRRTEAPHAPGIAAGTDTPRGQNVSIAGGIVADDMSAATEMLDTLRENLTPKPGQSQDAWIWHEDSTGVWAVQGRVGELAVDMLSAHAGIIDFGLDLETLAPYWLAHTPNLAEAQAVVSGINIGLTAPVVAPVSTTTTDSFVVAVPAQPRAWYPEITVHGPVAEPVIELGGMVLRLTGAIPILESVTVRLIAGRYSVVDSAGKTVSNRLVQLPAETLIPGGAPTSFAVVASAVRAGYSSATISAYTTRIL